MTKEKVELGRILFFDKRLSKDGTIACASCHLPSKAYTDGKPVSSGIRGLKGGRSAPTAINRVFAAGQFWDGRAASLEEQSIGPFISPVEHGFINHDEMVAKMKKIAGYRKLFKEVFGTDVTIDGVGKAIATGLDPIILTLVRFLIAALLFLPYVHGRFGMGWPGWRPLGRYSVISGALVIFFWLMFESLLYTTAFNTSVIFTLVPGISGMYSAVPLRERLGRYRLVALALAMAGALWVIFQGEIAKLLALELGRGDIIFFIGCLFMAAYTPLIRLLHRGEPMAVMTFWVLVTGSIWLLPSALGRLPAVHWQEVAPRIWWGILYLAIFCTIITFFASHRNSKICQRK